MKRKWPSVVSLFSTYLVQKTALIAHVVDDISHIPLFIKSAWFYVAGLLIRAIRKMESSAIDGREEPHAHQITFRTAHSRRCLC